MRARCEEQTLTLIASHGSKEESDEDRRLQIVIGLLNRICGEVDTVGSGPKSPGCGVSGQAPGSNLICQFRAEEPDTNFTMGLLPHGFCRH